MRSRIRFVTTLVLCATVSCIAADGAGGGDGDWDALDYGKADGFSSSTFGALAAVTVPPSLEATLTALATLGETSLPHDAKQPRKQVAETRDYVDIFSYAYPRDHGDDPWKEIRSDLDDGYEILGSFKDLFDVQGVEDPADAVYDPDEVAELRADVLAWLEGFMASDHVAEMRAFLADPDLSHLTDRPDHDLSPFFWGEADIEPSKNLSGLKNVAALERALLALARDDFDAIDGLKHVTDQDDHEEFHDFRKRVRSLVRVARYFPRIIKNGEDPAELLAVLDEVVLRYGDLNDRILAYDRAREEDDEDTVDELGEEIDELWDELRDWQKDADVDDVLRDLRSIVRKP
jgi:hypothetical protein